MLNDNLHDHGPRGESPTPDLGHVDPAPRPRGSNPDLAAAWCIPGVKCRCSDGAHRATPDPASGMCIPGVKCQCPGGVCVTMDLLHKMVASGLAEKYAGTTVPDDVAREVARALAAFTPVCAYTVDEVERLRAELCTTCGDAGHRATECHEYTFYSCWRCGKQGPRIDGIVHHFAGGDCGPERCHSCNCERGWGQEFDAGWDDTTDNGATCWECGHEWDTEAEAWECPRCSPEPPAALIKLLGTLGHDITPLGGSTFVVHETPWHRMKTEQGIPSKFTPAGGGSQWGPVDRDTRPVEEPARVAVDSARFVLVDPSYLGAEGEAHVLDLVARGLAVLVGTCSDGWYEVDSYPALDEPGGVGIPANVPVLVVYGPEGAEMFTEQGKFTPADGGAR